MATPTSLFRREFGREPGICPGWTSSGAVRAIASSFECRVGVFVDLGGLDALLTELQRDDGEVDAFGAPVRGRGVAEGVWGVMIHRNVRDFISWQRMKSWHSHESRSCAGPFLLRPA